MRLSSSRVTSLTHRPQQDFPLWDKAGTRPSLDLQFADRRDLVDATTGSNLVDFTRASSGTYVGSDGLIKTATTDEARFDHNPTTGESLGLLVEESRTNLLLNSATLATQNVTVTAIAHTLSFYGTGTVSLSGAHSATLVGTGAYPSRAALTFTPTAGTLTVTVSGTVEYANLEIDTGGSGVSFPTSYIPTTGSTATRAADVASISGSNFSSWYRQDEGTFFADIIGFPITSGQFPRIFEASDGTSNNIIRSQQYGANTVRNNISAGGSFTMAQDGGMIAARISGKTAFGVAENNCAITTNGGTPSVDNTVTLPSNLNQLGILGTTGRTSIANSTISRFTYWPQRLPNETLQGITQ